MNSFHFSHSEHTETNIYVQDSGNICVFRHGKLDSLILSWNSVLKTKSSRHIYCNNYNRVQFSTNFGVTFFPEVHFLTKKMHF